MEIVVWVDSSEYSGWFEQEEVEDFSPMEITTVGHLVYEDYMAVYLSHTVAEGKVLGVLAIPKGCILSRDELEVD